MSLSGASSSLSTNGSPAILLTKGEHLLETLPLVQAEAQHRNFILSTWVKSYESAARKQGIPRDLYAKYEPEIAESRWQDSWVVTDGEGYTILAWACGGDGKLWHCYVIPSLRRMRIATRIVEFVTGGLKEYAKPWPYSAHARLNPYLQRAR